MKSEEERQSKGVTAKQRLELVITPMAGLSTGPLLKPPLLCRLKLRFSSLEPSTLFGLRFSSPALKFNSSLYLSSYSSSYSVAASAGFGRDGSDDDDDDDEEEEAVNLSSVRYSNSGHL